MAGAGGKKRGRWIVRAILGIVAVCFLFVVLPFLSIRVPVVRSWLLDRSLHGRVLSPDWSLRIDSVDRFDPWGLRMQGLHLIYRGPEGDQEYASLGRLELRWDPRDLLRHRIWARQIGCDSLDLHTDVPAPTFIASEVSGADAGRESLRLPWLRLESFGLGVRILTDRITLASG